MKWTDIHLLATTLNDTYPAIDPKTVNFVDLMNWIIALPGFTDDPKHCSERVLEAIQQAWIDEAD